ncbi:hypothetical protein SSX86_010523 [Deinandra increscens subsp. villosa]|uniref:Helitron helicase-like domain-containing protein n=1 Tax=Deinandra increscens subsp. villosa TaxID=3103831 RepID=A0AAP0H0E3_9ASTR
MLITRSIRLKQIVHQLHNIPLDSAGYAGADGGGAAAFAQPSHSRQRFNTSVSAVNRGSSIITAAGAGGGGFSGERCWEILREQKEEEQVEDEIPQPQLPLPYLKVGYLTAPPMENPLAPHCDWKRFHEGLQQVHDDEGKTNDRPAIKVDILDDISVRMCSDLTLPPGPSIFIDTIQGNKNLQMANEKIIGSPVSPASGSASHEENVNMAVDFFNQVNILYGTLTEFCTPLTCPTMTAGTKQRKFKVIIEFVAHASMNQLCELLAGKQVDTPLEALKSIVDKGSQKGLFFVSMVSQRIPVKSQKIIQKRQPAHRYVQHTNALEINETPSTHCERSPKPVFLTSLSSDVASTSTVEQPSAPRRRRVTRRGASTSRSSSSLLDNHIIEKRPDTIARVFQLKVGRMLSYIRESRPFGVVTADLYTIEFQKRGLPHCHILIWVSKKDQIVDPRDIDKFISAEIPHSESDPLLYTLITESMMHGPCGHLWPNAVCMKDGRCSKHFPKTFENTTRFDDNGYVYYKRSRKIFPDLRPNVPLDNRFVVPYNRSLCLRFNAHINVEYCGWNMLIKYLFKYISKGTDRVRFLISKNNSEGGASQSNSSPLVDEIKNFVDGRFICPHEAAWRILNFPIHHRNPSVQVLSVHLEGMQYLSFRDSDHLQGVISNPVAKKTTLTEWFSKNQHDASGRHLRYVDYLSEYRWEQTGHAWLRRSTRMTPSIGRLIYIHPTCGEPFYMRMLLGHQRGCTSFESIRTVSGTVMPTYRAACDALGLLGNDLEWDSALSEATHSATASEFRSLFIQLLLYCDVTNPLSLWKKFSSSMSEDVRYRFQQSSVSHRCDADVSTIEDHVLYELELLLKSSSGDHSLHEFGLPMPSKNLISNFSNRLINEERNYDSVILTSLFTKMCTDMNDEQRAIFDLVTTSVLGKKQADGIHAVAASSYKLSYSTPLALQGCYRISCFSCNDPPTYLKTIDRPVALRFGSTATITPLEDSVIYPKLYFDFTEYENLIESTPTVDVFTDFIGLIDHVVDARTQDNAPYIRLYLKDGRNNITATLWKEIIMSDERFNRTTLDNTPRPCTVAITSVKVSKHKASPSTEKLKKQRQE